MKRRRKPGLQRCDWPGCRTEAFPPIASPASSLETERMIADIDAFIATSPTPDRVAIGFHEVL
ncbi:hypothetical protein D3C83_208330 [compost metagenome]